MTSLAMPAATASAPAKRRFRRAPLAAKLAFGFIGLVALVLIVNGAIDAFLSYSQAKRAALEVQAEKARAAAERVGVFLDEIQTELGWTAGVEWGYAKPEQQRYDFVRLLRQAPAITALSYIDGKGREQLAVSRLEPDVVGSGRDVSAQPRFVRAVADKVWFGPVEFRRGSEPYMTVALAHVGKTPGVTVADVNLKLVWDVVSAIHVGAKGFAYVVDDNGRLIAHPDLSLVLRDTDFLHLPQVAAALAGRGAGTAEARSFDGASVLTSYAVAPKTHWAVFVEQPLAEALATAYRTALSSLALLGLGLGLAVVSGVALARRMAAPIRALQAGAEKLGAGDLGQRLEIQTGDEIEALAGGFNHMAERLQESYENLEGKVEARTRDLNEALAQQTATADVLKTISRSAFDLQAVLDTLVGSAVRLFGADNGIMYVQRGDAFHVGAAFNKQEFQAIVERLRERPHYPGRFSVGARVLLTGEVQHVADLHEDKEYDPALRAASVGRAVLGVPMKRDGAVVGAIVFVRREPGPYPARQIEIAQTFADQAVIAIENARLFDEVQARTRELQASFDDLRKAQDRLVQSEKLASLGQLTAGIAHEIKNPLNFVNNFAALSRELLDELRETLKSLAEDARADADDLMRMIDSNLEKVASHGKRADSIVKNMLLHSREGAGERASVAVNGMVEEALNLGYHGARAEKPGFNVTLQKDFDLKAGEAEIYLQEVTRVLLNLISNGFYACSKRKLSEAADYAPTLRATTRDLGHSVEIRIRDNGAGIPQEVRAKMFNPFFTTKPAGEGTGLGLSLSHDIVVKQHGGTLEVETEPGGFTEFVMTLPRKGPDA